MIKLNITGLYYQTYAFEENNNVINDYNQFYYKPKCINKYDYIIYYDLSKEYYINGIQKKFKTKLYLRHF